MVGIEATPEKGLINVNTASVDLLRDEVVGIGQVLAERIVALREERGLFEALSDLTQVSGVGPALLARMAHQLTVGETPVAAEAAEAVAAAETAEEGQVQPSEEMAELPEGALGEEEAAQPADEAAEEEPPPAVAEIPDPAEGAPAEGEGVAQPTAETVTPVEGVLAEPALEEQLREAEPGAEPVKAAKAQEDLEAEPVDEPGPPEEALAEPTPMATEAAEEEEEIEIEPVGEAEPPPKEVVTELPPEVLTEVEAAAPAPEEEAAEEEEPPEAETAPEVAQFPAVQQAVIVRPKFWHSLLLVLLGGLVGVALTLAAAIIWSGTVDFAPSQEVDALSRNLHTMQSNQRLAWERIDQLTLRADELERDVARLEALAERVGTLEKGLEEAQRDLGETKATLDQVSAELAALRGELERSVSQLNERMGKAEVHLNRLVASLTKLEKAFEAVEARVKKFDAFFAALRDLLIDMEAAPTPALSKTGEGPRVIPTPTLKINGK